MSSALYQNWSKRASLRENGSELSVVDLINWRIKHDIYTNSRQCLKYAQFTRIVVFRFQMGDQVFDVARCCLHASFMLFLPFQKFQLSEL